MGTNERLAKLLAANPSQLAKIDAVLDGRDETNTPTETRLLTISDAAKKLGLARQTTYTLIKHGSLEVVQVNGVRRVPLASVIQFANGGKRGEA